MPIKEIYQYYWYDAWIRRREKAMLQTAHDSSWKRFQRLPIRGRDIKYKIAKWNA